jgi:hypothetical protein
MIPTKKIAPFECWETIIAERLHSPQLPRPHLHLRLEDEVMVIRWYEEFHEVNIHQIWTFFSKKPHLIQDNELENIYIWACMNLPVSNGEFSLHGRLDIHASSFPRWRLVVRRPYGRKVYPVEFVMNKENMRETLDSISQRVQAQDFVVRNSDAVLVLQSKSQVNSASSALYDLESNIAPYIDLNHDVRFIVGYSPTFPLYIGHIDVIQRLSEGIEDTHHIFSMSEIETLRQGAME